jgi:hypothetical protein
MDGYNTYCFFFGTIEGQNPGYDTYSIPKKNTCFKSGLDRMYSSI